MFYQDICKDAENFTQGGENNDKQHKLPGPSGATQATKSQ